MFVPVMITNNNKMFNIKEEDINLKDTAQVTKLVKEIDDQIHEKGIKKSHMALRIDEDPTSLSSFLSLRAGYITKDRIKKCCDYLDSINT